MSFVPFYPKDGVKREYEMYGVLILLLFQVPSHQLMGIPNGNANTSEPLLLSPLGESCLRMDLTAIHEILEKVGYKDDEGVANEVCC